MAVPRDRNAAEGSEQEDCVSNWLEPLRHGSFRALFTVQFFGAFNDSLFRSLLVTLIAFNAIEISVLQPAVAVTLAPALFTLPFVLFSVLAGEIADKYDKARLVRIYKAAELVIMMFALIGLLQQNGEFLLAVLFFMGLQSAFFGPVKYGFLPQMLPRPELLSANALFSALTFVAIIAGVYGGILAAELELFWAAMILVTVAVGGLAAAFLIAPQPPAAPRLRLNRNPVAGMGEMLASALRERRVRHCIFAISWFWVAGALLLSQLPLIARLSLGGDEGLYMLLLTVVCIGVGLGCMLMNRLLRGEPSSRYAPWACALLCLFLFDFAITLAGPLPQGLVPADLAGTFVGMRLIFDLFLLSMAAGAYVIPYYPLLQTATEQNFCSRVISVNNVVNSLSMSVAVILASAALQSGAGIDLIFLCSAGAALAAVFYAMRPPADLAAAPVVLKFSRHP